MWLPLAVKVVKPPTFIVPVEVEVPKTPLFQVNVPVMFQLELPKIVPVKIIFPAILTVVAQLKLPFVIVKLFQLKPMLSLTVPPNWTKFEFAGKVVPALILTVAPPNWVMPKPEIVAAFRF